MGPFEIVDRIRSRIGQEEEVGKIIREGENLRFLELDEAKADRHVLRLSITELLVDRRPTFWPLGLDIDRTVTFLKERRVILSLSRVSGK